MDMPSAGDIFAMFVSMFRSSTETPEQLGDLLEEDLEPNHIAMALNLDIERMLLVDPSYDPMREPGPLVPYLTNNGFFYDEGKKKFREANPSPIH